MTLILNLDRYVWGSHSAGKGPHRICCTGEVRQSYWHVVIKKQNVEKRKKFCLCLTIVPFKKSQGHYWSQCQKQSELLEFSYTSHVFLYCYICTSTCTINSSNLFTLIYVIMEYSRMLIHCAFSPFQICHCMKKIKFWKICVIIQLWCKTKGYNMSLNFIPDLVQNAWEYFEFYSWKNI